MTPRCQVIPEANHQAVFRVDGEERARWHFGPDYPRPFFYPLRGPGGRVLTRMGHPGAPNHDHHRSAWFAHRDVAGVDFWSDHSEARIRQLRWLVYEDGEASCAMAVELSWEAGHEGEPLMRQELVAVLRPGEAGRSLLELQSTFHLRGERLMLGKTNFGFLAVRMAKDLSAYFGAGVLTGSGGEQGEPALFGKPARWMNYAGPDGGITYFDHPGNPGHPNAWHVREDGWMGCAICHAEARELAAERPLRIRHLLELHGGGYDPDRAGRIAADFAASPARAVRRVQVKHRQYGLFPE